MSQKDETLSSCLAVEPPISKRKYNHRPCVYPGCMYRRMYGYGNNIKYCMHHRAPGMKRRWGACAQEFCYNNGIYGYPGTKHDPSNRCYRHRLEGMILFCKKKGCMLQALKHSRPPHHLCVLHDPSTAPLDDMEALDILIEESSSDEEITLVQRLEEDESAEEE